MTGKTILKHEGRHFELTGKGRPVVKGDWFLDGEPVEWHLSNPSSGSYAILREVTLPAPFPVEYECASYEGDSLIIKDDGPHGLYLRVLSEADSIQLSPADMADLHERLGRHLEALE